MDMDPAIRDQESQGVEGDETRAPHTPPSLGLVPVTEEERLHVLEGLLRLAERRPGVLLDPTTFLLTRLLIHGNVGSQTYANPEKVDALQKEIDGLWEYAKEKEDEVVKTTATLAAKDDLYEGVKAERDNALLERDGLQVEVMDLKAEAARLTKAFAEVGDQDEVEKVRALIAQVTKTLDDPTYTPPKRNKLAMRVNRIVGELQQMTTKYGGAEARIKELDKEVRDLKQRRGNLKKQSDATKSRVLGLLRRYEWCGEHPRFTVSRSGRRAECCPACLGLDPNKFQRDADTDHRRGCWLHKMIRETEALFR